MSREELILLKKLAKALPVTMSVYPSFRLEEIENIDERLQKNSFSLLNSCNPTIIRGGATLVKINSDRLFPVNHLRRLKKAYTKHGVRGVELYKKLVQENNKSINESCSHNLVLKLALETINPIL
jgi:hypothetical protein